MATLRRAISKPISVLAATAATAVLASAAPAQAAAPPRPAPKAAAALPSVGPWQVRGSYLVSSLFQNQGLATVALPGGRTKLWYDGDLTIPPLTYAQGWQHVGDPDSVRGHVVEPYQWKPESPTAKMFRIWTPKHRSYDFVHRLSGDEAMNNSFAAITPNGQWLVSGEWETENRLLIYPMPLLNKAARDSRANLPLTGRILLDHPVDNVQGCVFVTSRRLLCSSDDTPGAQFGVVKPLLQVDLKGPMTGRDVNAHVTALGPIPLQSLCSSPPSGYEVEGLDYDHTTRTLRVEVIQPGLCTAFTTVWNMSLP